MEEAVGDCTNLHITYPAMVAGYLFVMRANRAPEQTAVEIVEKIPAEQESPERKLEANDIAIQAGGDPVESVFRFHTALRELTGRRGIRNDVSRYEAVSLALIEAFGSNAGAILDGFPPEDSPLRFEQFFSTLYLRYDERFVYSAPDLKKVTSRIEWSGNSPVFEKESLKIDYPDLDFEPRVREVRPS